MSKYATEFSLNAYQESLKLFLASDIYKIPNNLPYHIYFILKCDKWYFKQETIIKFDDYFSVEIFKVSDKTTVTKTIKLGYPSDYKKDEINFSSTYPYAILKVGPADENGKIDREKAFYYNATLSSFYSKLDNKCEILYIGQSYGKNGERIVPTRLKKHETLEKIFSLTTTEYINNEILLFFYNFDADDNIISNGLVKPLVSSKDDYNHFLSAFSFKKKEKQIINIIEASLINHFKPQYNSTFKVKFPSKYHTSYKDFIDLDYHHFSISFSSELKGFSLFLKDIDCRYKNYFNIFYNLREEKEIFDLYKDL